MPLPGGAEGPVDQREARPGGRARAVRSPACRRRVRDRGADPGPGRRTRSQRQRLHHLGPLQLARGADRIGCGVMNGTLRVSGPAQLIEAVPYLLGFAPTESVVIIGLAANRVSVVGRVDLVDGEDAANAVVRQILGHSDAAAMVVYTERAVPEWISQPSAAVRDALLVSGG